MITARNVRAMLLHEFAYLCSIMLQLIGDDIPLDSHIIQNHFQLVQKAFFFERFT